MTAPPQRQAPPIEIGAVVAEKYRIQALLGEGGMGFVFAALHLQLGHRVALKVLRSSAVSDRDVTERFLREGRAVARLQGEHIARVSDVGTLPSGEPYLVMEFLEGQDLAHELAARGPLPLLETVEFIAQSCEALAEAHVRGIVHRDLKPANLFLAHKLDGDVNIKVLDFGISKVSPDGVAIEVENITVTSTLVGTPKYMSPEQIQDSRSVDSRTDIWGLGTIFYELLTQQRPFAAPSLALVCVKVLHEEVPAPSTIRPDIPPGVDAIIARCLKKNPMERYANVGELVEALVPFGNPSVRSSASRIQRILNATARTSGPRLSGADASGSTPGVISAPSTPSSSSHADSGQPLSRTPSAIRVDNIATLTANAPTVIETIPATKSRRARIVAIGAVLVIGSVLFVALRPSKSPSQHVVLPVATELERPTPPESKATAVEPTSTSVSAQPTLAVSATGMTTSARTHPTVRPPFVHHGATTAPSSTASQATAAPTQSAAPKGTGDVLEDRR